MIAIAIVDDKPQLIRNLQAAFEGSEEVEVVFTAINGLQAVERMREGPHRPEVILMDIEMPRMDGIEAVRQIKAEHPETAIIMLTVFDDEDNIFQAILAGATGYLLKEEKPAHILQAVADAREGRMPMSPLVAGKALTYLRQELPTRRIRRHRPEDFQLTRRESEILEQLAAGATYPQVAERLFISRQTVRNHVHHIYQKLEVKSKAEVIQLAERNKWFR
ncbi:MAG: DNA-binding response regulator [Bacteroidetes bacterium]|nr:MAG: DNA-binding response regulator [Bacteroidota bacterium]